MARISRIKILALASILPTVAFGIVVSVSYVNIANLLADEKLVVHTQEVIAKSNVVLATISNAENGQRGYLLTGNETYLDPYNFAVANIDSQIQDLKTLTADNPVQQSNIGELAPLAQQRLDILYGVIQAYKTKNMTSVVDVLNHNGGKQTMEKVHGVIDNMTNEENMLLVTRENASSLAAQNTKDTIIFGSSIAIAITAVTVILSYRRLRKEETLEKKNIDLQVESEKLRERDNLKDELSAMVSHELKTPLVTISGYAEMLREEGVLGTLNPEQQHAVNAMEVNCAKLERLIGDILDVQKVDLKKMKFRKTDFEVKEFLEEIIQIHTRLMTEKTIQFTKHISVDTHMTTDKDRLAQVFANLIKNSIDFAPENNGEIEIGARNEGSDKILFYVKDNGSGIPKEKQENLFKKFYQVDTTLKRKHGGTGLGLVICKGIVEGLGGNMWFESEEGKGTTFYFTIPKDFETSG